MANSLLPSAPFDFSELQNDCNDNPIEGQVTVKEGLMFSMGNLGEALRLDYGILECQSNVAATNGSTSFKDQDPHRPQQLQQQEVLTDPRTSQMSFDEYFGSCFPAPAAHPMQEVRRLENVMQPSSMSSSLELLNNFGGGVKKFKLRLLGGEQSKENREESEKKLSTEELMRIAGERYIQLSDQRYDDFSMLMHPFGYALSGLSEEETKDVELTHLLLATAEKVGCEQYDRASKLLTRCEWVSLERSNPVQRVVYYFAEALRERINKATGWCKSKDSKGKGKKNDPNGLKMKIANHTYYQKVPLNQILHLTSIQAIIDNIGFVRKLHLIDLQIRSGVQITALMQALAAREHGRPVEHLKVTAIAEIGTSETEETGRRLESFAKSMNFPFIFNIVYVATMSDISAELFKIASDEAVVVTCNMTLRTLLPKPGCLENLMRVIKSLGPVVMIVSEPEANHNSPIFVNRFIEALFYYAAYFDCLETCIGEDSETREVAEQMFVSGIHNIVAAEGAERITRNVKIDVWRAFFAKFGMIEIGFSETSLYQASLVAKQFPCGNLCTLDRKGKSLLVGWRGTPLHSLSAWKFSRGRLHRSFARYSLNKPV